MKTEDFRLLLWSVCDEVRDSGEKIAPGKFAWCPIGHLARWLRANTKCPKDLMSVETVDVFLDIPWSFLSAFIDGFDDRPNFARSDKYYQMGQEFRREYLT